MKTCFLMFSLLFSWSLCAQEDYTIQLNDTTFDIALEQLYQLTVNGQSLRVMLRSKDTLQYDDDFYTFKHSKDYKVSQMHIDEGIDQIMLMTAEGSGILIQKYSTINPTFLNELMLNEVTKESLNYGYEMQRQDYKRTLTSGEELNVLKAVLNYQDEVNTFEIASVGGKDEGIIVMTMMMMDASLSAQGQKIINMMWDTLEIKK